MKLLSLFVLLLLVGCSFSPPAFELRVREGFLSRHAPKSRTEYSCYLVNVTGSGLSATVGSENIGSFVPECAGIGVSSLMVKPSTLAEEGVRFKIAAGPQRNIEVLGVVSSLDEKCEGKPITELFQDGALPELYRLAAVKNQDLYVDTKLELTKTEHGTTESNILSGCTVSAPVQEPKFVKQVQIITSHADPTINFQNWELDLETGRLTKIDSLFINSAGYNRLYLSPDRRTLLAYQVASGMNVQFEVLYPGVLSQRTTLFTPSTFVNSQHVLFSSDSKYLYSRTPSYYFFGEYDTTGYKLLAPGFTTANLTVQTFQKGDRIFSMVAGAGDARFLFFPIPKTGSWTEPPALDSSGLVVPGTPATGKTLLTPSGLYAVTADNNYTLVTYARWNGAGDFKKTGESYQIGNSSAVANLQLYISADEKVLIERNTSGARTEDLTTYRLNSDGSVKEPFGVPTAVQVAHAILPDPSNRYLVTATTFESDNYLKVYELSEKGIGDEKHSITQTDGLAPGLIGAIAIPIF